MKKTVLVTITKEIEVCIPDEMLTEDYLDEFSSYMFLVDRKEDLFKYAAEYVARFDRNFVEEIEMLDDMLGWNLSIPAIVYKHNKDKRTALQDLMTKIHDKVLEFR